MSVRFQVVYMFGITGGTETHLWHKSGDKISYCVVSPSWGEEEEDEQHQNTESLRWGEKQGEIAM